MANKTLKSIKFPNLPDTYTIPQLASQYDSEAEYKKGDLVIYEDGLYAYKGQQHITDTKNGSVRGSFFPGDWELVKDLHGAIWFNSTELQLQGLQMDGSSWRFVNPVFIQSVEPPKKVPAGVSEVQSVFFPVGRGAVVYIDESLKETYSINVIIDDWRTLDVGLPVVELPEPDNSYLDSGDIKEFNLRAARLDGQDLTNLDIQVLNYGVFLALADSSDRGIKTDLYGYLASDCTEIVKGYEDWIDISGGSTTRSAIIVSSEDIPVGDGLFIEFDNWSTEPQSVWPTYAWLVTGKLKNTDKTLGYDFEYSGYFASGFGMWMTDSQRYIPRCIEVTNPQTHESIVKEIESVCLYFRRLDYDTILDSDIQGINQHLAIYRKSSSGGISIARNLKKNDPEAVRQFISVLREWWKLYCPSHEIAEAPIGGLTFIDAPIASNLDETSTDAASVLIAALSGMSPLDAVQRLSSSDDPDGWKNSRYPWAENLLRYPEYNEHAEVE